MDAVTLSLCTGARIDLAKTFVESINDATARYNINTPARLAMFLSNVGHESGGLRYTTELWGPTPTQSRYEGRKDLGNTQPGDGSKFRGHGLLQTTGRANHVVVRDRLRTRFPDLQVPDFAVSPQALGLPQWAALSAGDYWAMRELNVWADKGDFDGVCDLINRGRKTQEVGDSNGWEDRLKLYEAACKALAPK